jgi:hypothetical protein
MEDGDMHNTPSRQVPAIYPHSVEGTTFTFTTEGEKGDIATLGIAILVVRGVMEVHPAEMTSVVLTMVGP